MVTKDFVSAQGLEGFFQRLRIRIGHSRDSTNMFSSAVKNVTLHRRQISFVRNLSTCLGQRRTSVRQITCGLRRGLRPLTSNTYCTNSNSNDTESNSSPKWPLYSLKVTTSRDRWFEALDGLQFDVKYIDTCPKADPLMPTVLCIHGAPGSHRDFSTIVDGLVAEGVRVIIPNMPGYGETVPVIPEDLVIFTHATDERTEFILNFIDSLGLSQIDILLGHSLGCSPLYVLGARCSSVIRSIVFVNPVPYAPYRFAKPLWFFKTFPWLWDRSFFRPFLLGFFFLNKKRLGFLKWKARHVALSTLTCSGLMFPMITSSAIEIRTKKIPYTYLWSKNDHIFETKLSQETGELLGVRSSTVYDKTGQISKNDEPDTSEHYARAIVFEKGTHLCHRKYPQVVVNAVTNQLNHINSECNSRLGTNFGRTS